MTRFRRDLMVLAVMWFVGVGLYFADHSNTVVLQSFAIGVFLVCGSHIIRRIMFPNLDIQQMARRADESALGAAIVFASMLAFLVSVMWLGISVLK